MDENKNEHRAFDPFELAAAILLGLAAMGVAWSSYQSGLWGGKMTEAYSEASKITTEASTANNDMLVEMSHDLSVDVQAKILIAQGRDTSNETDRARDYELASYLYLYQLSEDAYKSLGLPADVLEKANKDPEPGQEDEDILIPEEELQKAFYVDLDDAYYDHKFKESDKMFDEADDRFDEGRKANDIGDHFDLAGVIFTASLFFAGLGLVLKSSARWGLFGLGALIFVAAAVYLFTLPLA